LEDSGYFHDSRHDEASMWAFACNAICRRLGRRTSGFVGSLTLATIVVGLALVGTFEPLERTLIDVRGALLSRPASGTLVIVEIDARSLRALNTWPWSRVYHASVLERLQSAGADSIAFDIDFSSRTTPASDNTFARALSAANGRAILTTFLQSGSRDGSVALVENEPLPELRVNAPLASVNISLDDDGRLRRYAVADYGPDKKRASLAVSLSDRIYQGPSEYYIDFGIQPASIPRLSYVDVLDGHFSLDTVRGRKVLIGATAVELGDRYAVPVYQVLSGVEIQALAYETLVQSRLLQRTGWLVTISGLLAIVFLCRLLLSGAWRRIFLVSLALAGCIFGVSLALQAALPISVDIAPWLVAIAASTVLAIVRQLEQQALLALRHRAASIRQRALMRSVFDDSFDGIMVADIHGRIETLNRAGAEMLRQTPDKARGCLVDEVLPGTAAVLVGDPGLLGTTHPQHTEITIRHDDGTKLTVELVVSRSQAPLQGGSRERGSEGDVFVIVFRDVSLRKAAEAARQQALQDAMAANRAKNEFLANMSHELRTPLNAIIGFSEVMKNQQLGPLENGRYLEYAADINSSGRHLLELINDVLDVSRIEAGRCELREEIVDLVSLLDSCSQVFSSSIVSTNKTFAVQLDSNLPAIRADERALKQVILNLLSNALKFTGPNGSIRLGAFLTSDGCPTIEVRDDGIGIPESHLARITEAFYQVDGSLQRQHEGSGLGLYLAKRLTELHGGHLGIESHSGNGTTVHVCLPRERIADVPWSSDSPPAFCHSTIAPRRSRPHGLGPSPVGISSTPVTGPHLPLRLRELPMPPRL
jgi:PAS domain S-box-containing protein